MPKRLDAQPGPLIGVWIPNWGHTWAFAFSTHWYLDSQPELRTQVFGVTCPCHGLACRVKIVRSLPERAMIDPKACQDRSVLRSIRVLPCQD